MIERGHGRTSGLTDWRLMSVPSMWACLQDQETTGQWKQVAGWRKICELARTHLSRLQEYRRGLAEAWPPETNAAARAYLAELDQLIDKAQRTHDAAATNHDALAAATRAIASTRADLKPIYDEYAAKLQQKQAYEATLADPKAVAGSRLPERPPVTDADLEQLNIRARSLMTGLSGELQQAQVMLRQPPPAPKTWPGREHLDPDVYGSAVTPVLPPIVPVPMASTGPESRASRRSTTTRPVSLPTAPQPGVASGPGPVLGGVDTGLASTHGGPNLPGTSPPSASAGSVGVPPSLPPVSHAVGRVPNFGSQNGQPNTASRSNSGGETHTTSPRPMPPGGLIGGTPGLRESGGGAVSPRRVNPVGGVIGGGGAGTAPTGAAGSRPGVGRAFPPNGMSGMPPTGGTLGIGPRTSNTGGPVGRPGRSEQGEVRTHRWDPDNPWETDTGVNPVVRPPNDQDPIDPGPAIGLDR
ncbi:hypothetical protein GA0070604_0758 [Micromonospora eburnea]|uniref:PPE family protein n=1 Tax=Micromonospora eburnea TaxID=227316 RepID=A0A1C6TTC9_9ACTN|nr:hypothetical protein [Micromonospora eburnea]SCL45056.1 hypothetical protein GA0070604_0758 [Micromonospora eburnea]